MALGFRFRAFQQTHPLLSTMPTSKDKRTQIATTRNDFIMLMKVHAHLIGCGPLENYRSKLTIRKRLAMVNESEGESGSYSESQMSE